MQPHAYYARRTHQISFSFFEENVGSTHTYKIVVYVVGQVFLLSIDLGDIWIFVVTYALLFDEIGLGCNLVSPLLAYPCNTTSTIYIH